MELAEKAYYAWKLKLEVAKTTQDLNAESNGSTLSKISPYITVLSAPQKQERVKH